ncbi:hypothetical protein H7H73_31635, partial [Mycobacterium rufum]|nr:hypothetical protein [Mycolicibacterium rufum]
MQVVSGAALIGADAPITSASSTTAAAASQPKDRAHVDGLTILVEVIASLTGSVRIAIERAEGLLVEHLQQHCSAEIY